VFDAPGETFRDALFEEYKKNRPEAPADLVPQWPLIHEVVRAFRIPTLTVPGVEADDVIGSLARQCEQGGLDCVIVTSDKDLAQLVSPRTRLWDTMRDRWTDERAVRERYGVEPRQMVEVLALMGDPIDNVPGVKGIGEKTAIALVRHFGSVEEALARLDEVRRMPIRRAQTVARLLEERAAEARLSRRLAEVRSDLPLELRLEDLRYESPDWQAVRPLFHRLGFQSLLRELPPPRTALAAAPPPAVGDREAAEALAAELAVAPAFALACVGTGSPMFSPCTGVVLAPAGRLPRFVPPEPQLLAALRPALESSALKVGHDLKADIVWLAGLGARLAGPFFDTMIAADLLAASSSHRLEDLCSDWLGEAIEPFRPASADPARATAGVARLIPLREALERELRDAGMEHLFFEVEMPLVAVLARMERRGVRLDAERLRGMRLEWERRLEELRAEIYALAGGEFNIQSPAQLREILFGRLKLSPRGVRRGKTGLSTDVDVLTRLAAEHPLPAKILAYRALAKLISTYVDGLLAAVHPRTGRLHTIYHQTGAATGRLSSSEPNLQNIPIRGEEGRRIRSAFVPDPGYCLLAADYSQIELRIMAHLSGDAALLAAFAAGADIHASTAAEIFGVSPQDVTPEMRRIAKGINFGILYGMGAPRLAAELGIALGDAQKFIDQYFERHPGVRQFIDRTVAEGRETGYVATMFRRRRPVPELRSQHRATAQAAARAAINTPIQGTAADLVKMAMVRIERRLCREGLRGEMILQVHDELVLEVPEEEVQHTADAVRAEMQSVASLRVPLLVDIGWGRSWAEAHPA